MIKKSKKVKINIIADLQEIDRIEDCGKFKEYVIHQNPDDENGLFLCICSWCENKKHIEFNKLIGKKIRLTIKEI